MAALPPDIAELLRAGYRASRQYVRVGAWTMIGAGAAMTVGFAVALDASYAIGVGVVLGGLAVLATVRALRFPGPELLETAIAHPERIGEVIWVQQRSGDTLLITVDDRGVTVRPGSRTEAEVLRRALALHGTGDVAPPASP
jgi:hypothetical protein